MGLIAKCIEAARKERRDVERMKQDQYDWLVKVLERDGDLQIGGRKLRDCVTKEPAAWQITVRVPEDKKGRVIVAKADCRAFYVHTGEFTWLRHTRGELVAALARLVQD